MQEERIIEADKFVVRDEQGVPRCVLGRHVDGSIGLQLSDSEARARVFLAVTAAGDLTLDFLRAEGGLACRVGLRQDVAGLTFGDSAGNARFVSGLDEQGVPFITLLGPALRPRAEFKATADGPAVLDFYDGSAKLRMRLTIVDDDTPSILLADAAEQPRMMMIVAADQTPGIMMGDGKVPRLLATVPPDGPSTLSLIDPDGKVTFQAP